MKEVRLDAIRRRRKRRKAVKYFDLLRKIPAFFEGLFGWQEIVNATTDSGLRARLARSRIINTKRVFISKNLNNFSFGITSESLLNISISVSNGDWEKIVAVA